MNVSKNRVMFFAVLIPTALFSLFSFAQPPKALGSPHPAPSSAPLVPTELNWRSMERDAWPSTDYTRTPVEGGAAIYTLSSPETLKFKINFIFGGGVYSLKGPQERTAFGAFVDLLTLGGFGHFNFDEFENYSNEHGISLKTSLFYSGELMVSADGLTQDFPKVLILIKDLMMRPRFDPLALALWKQQAQDNFKSLLDANTPEKQQQFMDTTAVKLAFGPEHYFAQNLDRLSPAATGDVDLSFVKKLYQQTINRNGLNVFLSGGFSQKDLLSLKKLVEHLPSFEPAITRWLPSREPLSFQEKTPDSDKMKTEVLTQEGLTQSNILLRYYYPHLGALSDLEEAQIAILNEVFSSTGGAIGTDRFSRALRAESGISYSPRAFFIDSAFYPESHLGEWNLSFQSPNEYLSQAVELATKTWDNFLNQGITLEELNHARTALINRSMAVELTVFNKLDKIMAQIFLKKCVPLNPSILELQILRYDAQQTLSSVNALLKKLSQSHPVPVLVVFGNPNADQIKALKKLKNIEVTALKPLKSIVKKYL